MAKKASKKGTKKATSKPQASGKAKAVSKAKGKAKTSQDAAVSIPSGFQNPYRSGGGYAAVISALAKIGVGRMHDRQVVLDAIREAMGESWSAFAKKESRNDETGKDAAGRAWQNCSVLARPQYGAKLRAAGYEIRFSGREGRCGMFKLGSA